MALLYPISSILLLILSSCAAAFSCVHVDDEPFHGREKTVSDERRAWFSVGASADEQQKPPALPSPFFDPNESDPRGQAYVYQQLPTTSIPLEQFLPPGQSSGSYYDFDYAPAVTFPDNNAGMSISVSAAPSEYLASPLTTPTFSTHGLAAEPWQTYSTTPTWNHHQVPTATPHHPVNSNPYLQQPLSQPGLAYSNPTLKECYSGNNGSESEEDTLRPQTGKKEKLRRRRPGPSELSRAGSSTGSSKRLNKTDDARVAEGSSGGKIPKISSTRGGKTAYPTKMEIDYATPQAGTSNGPTSGESMWQGPMAVHGYHGDGGSDNGSSSAGQSPLGAGDDTDNGGEHSARLKHNRVEQKYRNRLNAHFEALLEVLPPTIAASPEDVSVASSALSPPGTYSSSLGRDREAPTGKNSREPRGSKGGEDRERRVSKSEVLDRARQYIQTLESEHRKLAAEKRQLRRMWDAYGKSSDGGNGGGRS